jgi:hypothetical protein
MDKVGNFLNKRIKQIGIDNQVEANLICDKVKVFLNIKFPGQQLKFSFKNGILKIETENSILSQEISLLRREIKKVDSNIEDILINLKKI